MEHDIYESTIILSRVCPFCGKKHSMEFDKKAYQEGYHKYYHRRVLLQHAFPTFTPSQREFIKTGICDDCWDSLDGE